MCPGWASGYRSLDLRPSWATSAHAGDPMGEQPLRPREGVWGERLGNLVSLLPPRQSVSTSSVSWSLSTPPTSTPVGPLPSAPLVPSL